jgi:type IV pilus assembly protein PilA
MEKKMNNKGFSLVELIIVIAIMAVLIGVLAPQYLKYVERSRASTDVTNAQEIAAAVSAAIADGNTISSGTLSAVTAGGSVENLDAGTVTKSSAVSKNATFYITIDATKGVTGVYAGSDSTASNQLYPTVGTAYASYVTQ